MVKHAIKFFLFLWMIFTFSDLPAQIIVGEPISGGHNKAFLDSYTSHITITMRPVAPGLTAQPAPNTEMYLRASVWREHYDLKGKIRAAMNSGSLPVSTYLTLMPGHCNTLNSGGDLGTLIPSPLTLDGRDHDIITQIGTCYTGTGSSDGYPMSFSLIPVDYSQLVAGTYYVTVRFSFHDR